MKNPLYNLSIKLKLFILVAAPFLVLIYFSMDKIDGERKQINSLKESINSQNELKYLSDLVHECQKERDFGINYILNPLYNSQVQFENQIYQTDSFIDNYKSFLIKAELDTNLFYLFANLEQIRVDISRSYESQIGVEKYYDALVERLIFMITNLTRRSDVEIISNEKTAQLSLIQSKEYLARIRNKVNEAMVFGNFQGLGYGQFSGYKGAFESGLQEFLKYAPAPVKTKFQRDFSDGSILSTLEIIDYCFENREGKLTKFTSEYWWLSATGAINVLHDIELSLSLNIQSKLEEESTRLRSEINQLITVLLSVLTVLLLLLVFISRSITNVLSSIRRSAFKISKGIQTRPIKVYCKDELGELAITLNHLAASSNAFSKIASKIGDGAYDVSIELRSDKDELSISLMEMRDALRDSRSVLNQKISELKNAYRYKSDFLANMSHELRTPLNSLLILSELLSNNDEGNLSSEQVEYAQTIVRSGRNLLELINDILDLSKIESGKMDVKIKSVLLHDVLENIKDVFKPTAKNRNIDFEINNLLPDSFKINTDTNRLQQILKNLLSNAIKFTNENGSVKLVITEENNKLLFKVIDTGIGISKENQIIVFDAFKQIDGSINRKYDGTGLGLSITKKLVEMLGGEISLQSELNKGTTMEFYIPTNMEIEEDTEGRNEINIFSNQKSQIEHQVIEEETQNNQVSHFKNIPVNAKEELKGLKVILYDTIINHVFELSSELMDFEVEVFDTGDIEELNDKYNNENPDVILVSYTESIDLQLLKPFVKKIVILNFNNTIIDTDEFTIINNWNQLKIKKY